MQLVDFPVRIDRTGKLVRADNSCRSVDKLLAIMLNTSQTGWPGVAGFGVRDALVEFEYKRDTTRKLAIKQINEAFENLGIDWARVEAIEREPAKTSGKSIYIFKVSFSKNEAEDRRVEMKF